MRSGRPCSTSTYHHGKVDSTDVDVHPHLAAQMDRLTMVDRALFALVLRGFIFEIRVLEGRVGRRILCPEALWRAEPKLAYVANVTALYGALVV